MRGAFEAIGERYDVTSLDVTDEQAIIDLVDHWKS